MGITKVWNNIDIRYIGKTRDSCNSNIKIVGKAFVTFLFILVTMKNIKRYNPCRGIMTKVVYTKVENNIHVLLIGK